MKNPDEILSVLGGQYSPAYPEENIQTANNYGYDEIGNLKFDKAEGIESIEWTAYGKVKSITRQANYYKTINDIDVYPSNLEFLYDAMGNRIAKIEKPRDANGEKSAADWKTTYYIRDAQGNPMATYKKSSETEAASFKLIEHPIYGSSRVGIDNYTVEFVGYTAPSNGLTSRVLGLKQYELTNHLGNVLTTISDKRIPVENNGVIDYYVADITTVSDYYPFGSPMDGRTFYSEKCRYSFNTQEKLDEVYGKGNLNTALFWEYDTRLGRRWNLDPNPQINISDYAVMGNSPICNNDLLGDIFDVTNDNAKKDVKSMPNAENEKYVKFDMVNINETQSVFRVRLDFGEMPPEKIEDIIKNDKGLGLINDLVTAQYKDESGNIVDYKLLYDVSYSYSEKQRGSNVSIVKGFKLFNEDNRNSNALNGLSNLSVVPRNINGGAGNPDKEPGNPYYQGVVTIAPGIFFSLKTKIAEPRASTVFHELGENFYRTVFKMPYIRNDELRTGAHREIILREGKTYTSSPGVFPEGTIFIPQFIIDMVNDKLK